MTIQLTEPQMNATYTVATAKSLSVLSESLAEVSQDDAAMLASIDTGKPVMAVNGGVRFVVDGVDTIGLDAATPCFATLTGKTVEIIKNANS